ncbi:hypothetical protein HN832_02340 [archaeon]|nr:hypothetical protein [archaeon]MBT4373193.1 hypothetical protein [archaeon]MBT4531538.1 hypothetical protein [archaeon]MBT7001284.1 hypothetical protein [archaeon]MBT7282230.1 hypothetical protein [archaeon]
MAENLIMSEEITQRLENLKEEGKMCPFLYDGSPCASEIDRFWAMSCPNDYQICNRYSTQTELNSGRGKQ